MVFKCQEDGFLKEFDSEVVNCVPANFETIANGVKTKLEGYEITCKDTILFPEGGGQPFDQGYLNEKRVYQVLRRGDQAIHYLTESINIGESVKQVVDWNRRFDHMQQHSGQHLISAILQRDFGFKTVAWWLGEEVCHIELDTPQISLEQIKQAELVVNDLIRASIKVSVEVLKKDTPTQEENPEEIRLSRGLPEDHQGDIRVITIDGIDNNMCCGTHVTNLSQLQIIKLLHSEKSKRKNQILLYFLIGGRVLQRLEQSINREQKITTILNNGPLEHVDLITKLSKNSKVLSKNLQVVLKDLAILEANRLKQITPPPKYFLLHRKEAEPDFINNFIKEFGSTDTLLLISTGDEKGVGNVALYGKENIISDLGNKVCELLSGKGAGKGNRFQAKVNNLSNKSKVKDLFKDYFNE